MRSDQYIGLNSQAKKYLATFQRPAKVIELAIFSETVSGEQPVILSTTERMIPIYKVTVIGKIEGAWNDHVADLHRYEMPDGSVLDEYVQSEPWSSGPCYFIALRSPNLAVWKASLWTDKELEAA